jgi:hypothetical protein
MTEEEFRELLEFVKEVWGNIDEDIRRASGLSTERYNDLMEKWNVQARNTSR